MTPKQNSPRIIAHRHPSRHLLFLLSPLFQVAVEPNQAKLIQARTLRISILKINQITKFGTLKKPSLFDVINFRFEWNNKNKIFRVQPPVSNIGNNRPLK